MSTVARNGARILIASDSVSDAALVKKILHRDFENIVASTDPSSSVADCDQEPPAVLIVAFDTLEKAQRYFLGICRHSRKLHLQPYRTVLLCSLTEAKSAYDLCRTQLFDDYALFWPMTHDAMRLPMAVHIALRELASLRAARPTAAEFATEVRQLSGLENLLEQGMAEGIEQVAGAEASMARVGREVDAVLDGLPGRLARQTPERNADTVGVAGLQREIDRIKREEIQPRLRQLTESIQPLTLWASRVARDVQPHLQSARALKGLADRLLPRILVVDDDEFQHKIIASVLTADRYHLVFAASGAEALGLVHESVPDLILMDVMMPHLDGKETTRRLRAQRQFAKIPLIMMTGNSNGEVVSESIRAGATDFVVKPIDRAKLIAKVASGLGTKAWDVASLP